MKTLTMSMMLALLAANTAQAAEPTRAPAPAAATPAPASTPARSTDGAKPQTPAATAPAAAASDSTIELDTTQITGNRELPRVLYVVPWKRADLGQLSGKPAKSLLDEVLAPVDRDVFQRQNRYHEALQPDAPKAPVAPPAN
jgi:hypothetical protein